MRTKILLLIIPAVIVLALGSAGLVMYQKISSSEMEGDLAAHSMDSAPSDEAGIAPATGEEEEEEAPAAADGPMSTAQDTPALESQIRASDIHVTVEGTDPKAPKSIGSIDAPVTMVEYSSLTCPHCAHAHETVLPRLIKQYVETGKLRIVFNDFPLNQQAMDASKVSRCMGPDQYFGFLTLLFSSIDQWAYGGNHPNALIQNAVLAGLPEDKAKACLNDQATEAAIVEGVQTAVRTYNVSSTPTFVLNNGAKTIQGARDYADFEAAIDSLLPPAQ